MMRVAKPLSFPSRDSAPTGARVAGGSTDTGRQTYVHTYIHTFFSVFGKEKERKNKELGM